MCAFDVCEHHTMPAVCGMNVCVYDVYVGTIYFVLWKHNSFELQGTHCAPHSVCVCVCVCVRECVAIVHCRTAVDCLHSIALSKVATGLCLWKQIKVFGD